MRKSIFYAAALGAALVLPVNGPVLAQSVVAQGYPGGSSIQAVPMQQVADPMMEDIGFLQREWARIKYRIGDKDAQLKAIHRLEARAADVTARYPHKAEPKIWEGIILSTDAGIVKGLSALGKVKKARKLFEAALKIDEKAMDGSAHTSLGSLYYQVPGWPIGFGDDDKAEAHLQKALRMNPNGIDPNFFYGDFLLQEGKYEKAARILAHALEAPDRPDRPIADAGRRDEIRAALATAREKAKNKDSQFN